MVCELKWPWQIIDASRWSALGREDQACMSSYTLVPSRQYEFTITCTTIVDIYLYVVCKCVHIYNTYILSTNNKVLNHHPTLNIESAA